MSTKAKSRRAFLIQSAGTLNAAWIAAHYHDILAAQQYASKSDEGGAPPKLAFFTAEQAAEIEAIADQIIPTDDTPGAREARCLYFIDRALTTFAKKSQPVYTQGLLDLQAKTKELYPNAGKFSALTSEQQIRCSPKSRRRRSSIWCARTQLSVSSRAPRMAATTTK